MSNHTKQRFLTPLFDPPLLDTFVHPESVKSLIQTIALMVRGTDGRFPWERDENMRAVAYSRDLDAGRLLPFEEKFSGLLRLCEQAKTGEFEIVIVAGRKPWVTTTKN